MNLAAVATTDDGGYHRRRRDIETSIYPQVQGANSIALPTLGMILRRIFGRIFSWSKILPKILLNFKLGRAIELAPWTGGQDQPLEPVRLRLRGSRFISR